MRLLNGLALAGLAGLAVGATHEPAEVYILSSNQIQYYSSTTPKAPKDQLPRQLARDILFQRLLVDSPLCSDIVGDDTLQYISKYGRSSKPLFAQAAQEVAPSQLVVLVEGVTKDNVESLKEGMREKGHELAFTISDAPSAKANKYLVDDEFSAAGVSGSCDVAAAINPYDSCWNGMSLVVKYDIAKNPHTLQSLVDSLPSLVKSVSSGTLEATLVLIPESTRSSKHAYWTTETPSDLRRRFIESPISDTKVDKVTLAPGSGGIDLTYSAGAAAAADKMNLGCFSTYSSCVTATNNCTGHGKCLDKFAVPGQDTQEGDKQCFVCSCLSTKKNPELENSKHIHWGGAYCQKIDVSSPFWLIATTTILLVGVVTGCIGLLFSVGEEKLPGVIGAGVSRSK